MKPILFVDFDGTICTDRYWRSLSPETNTRIQALLFGDDTTMVHDWMRGHYTAEEVNAYAAKELSLEFQGLWELFVSDCQTMHIPMAIRDVLHNLRGRYTTVLMTGNMDSFSRFTVPALQLTELFDYISNSYEEGKHKTDDNGSLFTDWTKRLNGEISTSILIDDNSRCCEIFTELGGITYQTTGLDNTLEILIEL